MSRRDQVKGAAVREFLIFLMDRLGADVVRERLAALPNSNEWGFDPARPALGVLAGSWYPCDQAEAVLEALLAGRGAGERARLIQESVAATMEANLKRLYARFFLRVFVSPAFYVKHVQRLWALHFDGGIVTAHLENEATLLWEVRDWAGYSEMFHQIIMASEPTVFGAMGCKNVSVKKVAAAGDVAASHRITWASS